MNTARRTLARTLGALALLLGVPESRAVETPRSCLSLVQTIPLPRVNGRIDHLAWESASERVFVAALGNNTVEVVDLKAGKVVRSLTGFSEPQGVAFVPEFNRLYVANGGDGAVRVLDATDFAEVATVKFGGDADNVRYDAAAKRVYVGWGEGAIGCIDATTNTALGSIALPGHPESLQLEQDGPRIFVNVPGSRTVAVVDRRARKVIGHWPLGLVAANFPMALDEASQRLFVGCRAPSKLLVFDTISGKEIARLDLHGDCDDVFYDAQRHRVYASCGEGHLDVFDQRDADHYRLREAVPTSAKARTCLFDGGRIFLAVPRQARTEARLHVFRVE